MVKEEAKIAVEMNDLFLQLTEMLWEHVSVSHIPTEKFSFNITEHYLIEFLGKESFASMSKLSQIIHVAPTTMTSIVDRLIRRGYLYRRRAQQDRRKVLVTLSEKGRQIYEQHHHQSMEMVAHFLSTLPDKGSRFYQSLMVMKQNLDELRGHLRNT